MVRIVQSYPRLLRDTPTEDFQHRILGPLIVFGGCPVNVEILEVRQNLEKVATGMWPPSTERGAVVLTDACTECSARTTHVKNDFIGKPERGNSIGQSLRSGTRIVETQFMACQQP
jgi:hypothetical protein